MQTAVQNGQPSPTATLAEKLIIRVSRHQASFDKRNLNCTNRPTDWQKYWLSKTSNSSLRRWKRLSLFKNHFRYVQRSLNESRRRLHAVSSTRDATLVSSRLLAAGRISPVTQSSQTSDVCSSSWISQEKVPWSALAHMIILLDPLPVRSGCGRCGRDVYAASLDESRPRVVKCRATENCALLTSKLLLKPLRVIWPWEEKKNKKKRGDTGEC